MLVMCSYFKGNMEYSNSDENVLSADQSIEIPSCDSEPHLLISSVRKSYLKYMIRLFCENYVGWCGERAPREVVRAARDVELRAASRAMLVPLYREAILPMIKSVKKYTANKDLLPEVEESCIKSQSRSKGTQTEDCPSLSHHTAPTRKPTDNVQTQLSDPRVPSPQSIHTSASNRSNVVKINDTLFSDLGNKEIIIEANGDQNVKVSVSSDEDNVMMEMEKLFQTDKPESEDDIFHTFICDKQVKMIMEEINQYETTAGRQEEAAPAVAPVLSLDARVEQMLQPVRCNQVSSSRPTPRKYVYSRWPCELYYQKRKLRLKLDLICEKSFKLHAKIKNHYTELFGYDSEDEQCLESPICSEEFVRSCRTRAAPLMLRHLRGYVRKARLPSRLLKPLWRHLLYRLVDINQYPDDYECFLFVKEYFHHRPRIRCQADF